MENSEVTKKKRKKRRSPMKCERKGKKEKKVIESTFRAQLILVFIFAHIYIKRRMPHSSSKCI